MISNTRLAVAAALFLTLHVASAVADDPTGGFFADSTPEECQAVSSQAGYGDCIDASLKKHDAELNRTYGEAIDAEQDPDALRTAQRAWIKHRDAECKRLTSSFEGTRRHDSAKTECLIKLTRQRTKELSERARAAPPSPYPSHGIPQFVVDHLDVLSFPSSIGPRRSEEKRLFKDYDVLPKEMTETTAELEQSDGSWRFGIRILEHGARGILICLEDQARNGGSYHAQSALLLVSKDGRLVADEKKVKRKDCREFAE